MLTDNGIVFVKLWINRCSVYGFLFALYVVFASAPLIIQILHKYQSQTRQLVGLYAHNCFESVIWSMVTRCDHGYRAIRVSIANAMTIRFLCIHHLYIIKWFVLEIFILAAGMIIKWWPADCYATQKDRPEKAPHTIVSRFAKKITISYHPLHHVWSRA